MTPTKKAPVQKDQTKTELTLEDRVAALEEAVAKMTKPRHDT